MDSSRQEKYRQTLLRLRDRARDEVDRLTEALREELSAPGELSNLPTHSADRDAEGMDVDMVLENTEAQIVRAIDEALERIERGAYGRCEDCGRDIPRLRLDAIPYTAYCIDCERRREQQSPFSA